MEQKNYLGIDAITFRFQPFSMKNIEFNERRNAAGSIVFRLTPYRQRFVSLVVIPSSFCRADNKRPFSSCDSGYLRDLLPALRVFLKSCGVPLSGLRCCAAEVNFTSDLSNLKNYDKKNGKGQVSQLLQFLSCALLHENDCGVQHFVGIKNADGLVCKQYQSLLLKRERRYSIKLYDKSAQLKEDGHLLRFEVVLLQKELSKIFASGGTVSDILSEPAINALCGRFAELTLNEIIPDVCAYQRMLSRKFVRLARESGIMEAFSLLIGNNLIFDESGVRYAVARFYGKGKKSNVSNMVKKVLSRFNCCTILSPFVCSLRRACRDLINAR